MAISAQLRTLIGIATGYEIRVVAKDAQPNRDLKVIQVSADNIEPLLHELGHWAVADPTVRDKIGFGILDLPDDDQWEQEAMANHVVAYIYREANAPCPLSEKQVRRWHLSRYAYLKSEALSRYAAAVPLDIHREIVSVLGHLAPMEATPCI